MKAANSYGSIIRGVSQQVPQDRADGQHTEQVNLLSDPVNGLVRRHGSIWQAEQHRADLTPANFELYLADTDTWTSFDYDSDGNEYTVLYRRGAYVANDLPPFFVYNKTTKTFLDLQIDTNNTIEVGQLNAGGVSAITNVGKYLFMCGNSVPISGQTTPKWSTTQNGTPVIWIRGGAYSREFKITYKLEGDPTVRVAQYNTPSASYQGVLTTADIPATDPEYAKKVNDRVNAYNSAVTSYIGTAAASITPAAIATNLLSSLLPNVPFAIVNGSCIIMQGVALSTLEVDDGGDGSLMVAVWKEVASPDKVSPIHVNNKVVKVRAANSNESYYLRAVSKDPALANNPNNVNVGEVLWVEGAGDNSSIGGGFFYATAVGNTLYLASSAERLGLLTPGPHPEIPVSTVGDADNAPLPYFVGRKVTYLGTFQNRLLVGCGGVLAASRTDDFLNFFRSTVLTVPADDPFEMLPAGSEDDTLLHSALYDQDLVVFGKKRQYRVAGNIPLTPTSANMSVLSNYEGVADSPPVAAGGYIFYAKRGSAYSDVHQMQPGQTENSPESFPASSQLDSYLTGNAIEMAVATGAPSHLFMRTTGARESVFVFSYLDKQDGRKLDAWSRWDFGPTLGRVLGFSVVPDGLMVYFLRKSTSGNSVYVVADLCPTVTTLSDRPYLDSNRTYFNAGQPRFGTANSLDSASLAWSVAIDGTSPRRNIGVASTLVSTLLSQYPTEADKLIVGANQVAYFTPTNPYVKDGKDKAIITGRLTVTKIAIAFKQSTGFDWTINYRDVVQTGGTFNGRILGDPANVIGQEPISTGQHSIPIGRETRQYDLTIFSRSWFPLTVTALEWVGQFFNRTQRF